MAKVTREQEAECLARASFASPTLGETLQKIAASAATERQEAGSCKGRARGRHVQGERNRIEQAYEDTVLVPRKARGEILGYWFEPIKLRLGKACYYEPDFLVMLSDLSLELHEVKAMWGNRVGWQEDARVKFKAAAERYAIFAFVAVAGRPKGGVWTWAEERL